MIAAIEQHHGHVTELVGDGLLALFGALEPNPWQSRDAVLATDLSQDELLEAIGIASLANATVRLAMLHE